MHVTITVHILISFAIRLLFFAGFRPLTVLVRSHSSNFGCHAAGHCRKGKSRTHGTMVHPIEPFLWAKIVSDSCLMPLYSTWTQSTWFPPVLRRPLLSPVWRYWMHCRWVYRPPHRLLATALPNIGKSRTSLHIVPTGPILARTIIDVLLSHVFQPCTVKLEVCIMCFHYFLKEEYKHI